VAGLKRRLEFALKIKHGSKRRNFTTDQGPHGFRGGGPSIIGEKNGNLETENTDKEGHGITESPTDQTASGSQPGNVEKTANNLYSAMDNLIKVRLRRVQNAGQWYQTAYKRNLKTKSPKTLSRSEKIKTCIDDIFNMSKK